MAPPRPPPPTTTTGMVPVIDHDIWLACATPYSGRLPVVGSAVYYFPQGRAEQCHTCTTCLIPDNRHRLRCTVTGIDSLSTPSPMIPTP